MWLLLDRERTWTPECPITLKTLLLFVSGKSFLRNRLFRGLDSWPPSSFCVSLWTCFYLSGFLHDIWGYFSINWSFFVFVFRPEGLESLTLSFQIFAWVTCSISSPVVLPRFSLTSGKCLIPGHNTHISTITSQCRTVFLSCVFWAINLYIMAKYS